MLSWSRAIVLATLLAIDVAGTTACGGSGGAGGGSTGSGGGAGSTGSGGGAATGARNTVAVFSGNTCEIKPDGTLWCWGANGYGELGIGTFASSPVPKQVTKLGASVVEVVLSYQTCARKTDDTMWCWGVADMSEPSPVRLSAAGSNVAEIASSAGDTCARKTDGTVWCVAKADETAASGLGHDVAQIAAGNRNTCARETDGTLRCWGSNVSGQLGDGTTSAQFTSPVQVSALGTSVAEVAVGLYNSTCAIKTDGTLWCWGSNSSGQLGTGTTSDEHLPVQVSALGANVAGISMGEQFACARKTDGTVWCWGANDHGQLGDGTQAAKPSPVQVTALGTDVTEIAATSLEHACARKSDGTLWCWGSNAAGQFGDGTTVDSSLPVQVH